MVGREVRITSESYQIILLDSNGITNRNGRLAGELEESGGSDQSDDDAGIDAELEEEIENADMAFWGF